VRRGRNLPFAIPARLLALVATAAVAWSSLGLVAHAADERSRPAAVAAPDLAAAMVLYRHALAEYQSARASYDAAAESYWRSIAEKRRLRRAKRANHETITLNDYVLAQPPVYTGPPKPRDPTMPPEAAPLPPYVPVVADFLAAAQREFNFVPLLPQSESAFKQTYARVALTAGLGREQIVRIYAFEAGGNGEYDVQAGLENNKRAHAITTALGYNQLLSTNSVEIVAESGNAFVRALLARAARLPHGRRSALDAKLVILRKMIGFARSVPDDWNKHQLLANTPKGLGVHALNLDLDIGPLLQTQKLMDSIVFARRKGLDATLTAAELEMMNLTGDGSGFDMITMPAAWRDKVATANFFQQSGYRDNPVAQRNNVVAKLIAATDAVMDREIKKPGAKELLEALR